MADRIVFSDKINASVQVGDTLYYTTYIGNVAQQAPIEVAPITRVGDDFVEIDPPGVTPALTSGMFFMFKKPRHNNPSVKGYYAEARISTGSSSKIELFSIGSEITQSSK